MTQDQKLRLLHNPPAQGGRRGAFSLVELLVVLAVIVILAALFLPALDKARQQARIVQCGNNLQQISVSFQVYASEYNGRITQCYYGRNRDGMEIGYDEKLATYGCPVGVCTNKARMFTCPNQKRVDYPHQPGYGLNGFYENVLLSPQTKNSLAILLAETRGPTGTGSHRADRDNGLMGALDDKRHAGFANYLFLDGHVELSSRQDTLNPINLWGLDPREASAATPSNYVPGE